MRMTRTASLLASAFAADRPPKPPPTMSAVLRMFVSMPQGRTRRSAPETSPVGRLPRDATDSREQRAFVTQEPFLAPQTAAVAAQRPVGGDHAVTRNHQRNGVVAVRRSHRSRRARASDPLREGAVGSRPPRRDGAQRRPDLALEGSAGAFGRHALEGGDAAGEVSPERIDHERWSRALRESRPRKRALELRAELGLRLVELERAQAGIVRREDEAPHGGIKTRQREQHERPPARPSTTSARRHRRGTASPTRSPLRSRALSNPWRATAPGPSRGMRRARGTRASPR